MGLDSDGGFDAKRLRELLEKASGGEWQADGPCVIEPLDDLLIADTTPNWAADRYAPDPEANAALIAAMYHALPALLTALESKDAEIARLESEKAATASAAEELAARIEVKDVAITQAEDALVSLVGNMSHRKASPALTALRAARKGR